MLSPAEHKQYSRHILLPEVGVAGQEKLKASSVLVVGAGGLGCPMALYLAAAGVGRLGIIDFDTVDTSNLQRQILFTHADVGRKKVKVAKERLLALNPHIEVETYDVPLDVSNAMDLFEKYDVVADGTDNFATRFLVNDASYLSKTPNVYGSIFRFEGQVTVFNATDDGPCYRCLYPEAPDPKDMPSCAEAGVLGILPATVASLQSTEAIKLLLGIGKSSEGTLRRYDALSLNFQAFKVHKDPNCPLCSKNPSITGLTQVDWYCQPEEEKEESMIPETTVTELIDALKSDDAPKVLDVRRQDEYDKYHIDGSTFIPLDELNDRLGELDQGEKWVVHCHSGMRSAKATDLMLNSGFSDVKNLAGGIAEWMQTSDEYLCIG